MIRITLLVILVLLLAACWNSKPPSPPPAVPTQAAPIIEFSSKPTDQLDARDREIERLRKSRQAWKDYAVKLERLLGIVPGFTSNRPADETD